MQLLGTHTMKRPFPTHAIWAGIIIAHLLIAPLLSGWFTWGGPGQEQGEQIFPAAPMALPLSFIPNAGQLEGDAVFEAIGASGGLTFGQDSVQVALPDGRLMVEWVEANGETAVTGTNPLPGTANIYRGSDASRWQTNLPTYKSVTYAALYPGIDLVYDGSEGLLKGTYYVAPGADPSLIGWRYEGGTAVTLNPLSGDLHIALNQNAVVTEKAPLAYQVVNGRQQPVEAAYWLDGDTVRFALGAYDRALPLVIDPTLVYSSYFGGGSDDVATDVAVDSGGNVYVVGHTYSGSLPGGGGGIAGYNDLFVTKINAAGTAVIYTTILGGSGSDEPAGVAVNGSGSKTWVTGTTTSDNLPTFNAFQPTPGGGVDAFVMQFNSTGGLAFSSYYGGGFYDAGEDIALDSAGNAHLVGSIWGGFFAKINGQTYQNEYERMISGQEATGYGIALDSQNNIYVTGKIRSDSWPTVNPVQSTCGAYDNWTCSDDAFVVKLPPTGDDLLFSTYLGGSAANGGSGTDIGRAIAVDGSGNIAVVGETFASDFPVWNAVMDQKPGSSTASAAFVTRLVKQGSSYQMGFSTYLGGSSSTWATSVAMNSVGQVFVAGGTGAANYPTAAAWQSQLGPGVCFSSTSRNCYDAFIAQFAAAGSMPFSTYWGGTDDDVAEGVALDSSGNLIVVGSTESNAFPVTAGGFQPNRSQNEEAFVVKLNTGQTNPPPPPIDLPYSVYLPTVIR
ncbi:MAG: SBBP repeat-containing protein [Anaerolineaceae bacterium]|nr:SBBP repeat-containing protein [Anaerolineaceae bacterium]